VEGLLGIGAAGGNKAAAAEGKKLDDRLKLLREERAKRAPVMKAKEPVAVGAPPASPNNMPPNMPAMPQKPNRRKNKKKKGRR
jgi:hypothetical protein